MTDILSKLHLSLNWDSIIQILLIVGAWNLALSGLGKGLEAMAEALDTVKDKTASKLDDNVAAFAHTIATYLGKFTGGVQGVIDWVQGNRSHVDPTIAAPAPAAAPPKQ